MILRQIFKHKQKKKTIIRIVQLIVKLLLIEPGECLDMTEVTCSLLRPVYCSASSDLRAPESATSDLLHCVGKIGAASQS